MRYYANELYIEKFRLIEEQTFNLGKNITVFSGINGVGKSNIMSLITSMFGTDGSRLAGGNFFPHFDEYFKITQDEFLKGAKDESEKYYSYLKVISDSNSDIFIQKRQGLKDDTKDGRGIRVLPRPTNHFTNDISIADVSEKVKKIYSVGTTARIPVPTIFLSLARLYPIGETEIEESKISSTNEIFKSDAIKQYIDWYNEILPGSINPTDYEVGKIKKLVNKNGKIHVQLKTANVETESIGQDNLGSIISALVDFYFLKYKQKDNYIGGILSIDEFDSSLHPSALMRLFLLLKRVSDELDLQIFLTTHSLIILEKIFQLKNNDSNKYQLIYIIDPEQPRVTEFENFNQLKSDLFDDVHYYSPKIKVYVEDELTEFIFNELVEICKKTYDSFEMPNSELFIMHLGHTQLESLREFDVHFESVVMVVDGDAKLSTEKNQLNKYLDGNINGFRERELFDNIIALPTVLAPESYLYHIAKQLYEEDKHKKFWNLITSIPEAQLYTKDRLGRILDNVTLRDDNNISNSEIKKQLEIEGIEWLVNFFDKAQILTYYYNEEENQKELEKFYHQTSSVLKLVSNRGKSKLF